MEPKIFGIGLSKSGSHSLSAFLNSIGIWCVHNPSPSLMTKHKFHQAIGPLRAAAVDTSVSAYFKELDKVCPHSAFILTHRHDEDAWEKSCINFFRGSRKKVEGKEMIRRKLFSTSFKQSFRNHRSEVLKHFEHSERFLEIDVTNKKTQKSIPGRIVKFLLSWRRYLKKYESHISGLLQIALARLDHHSSRLFFPHIRNEEEYRKQCTCMLKCKEGRTVLFFAGYVKKKIGCDAWGKRYVVFWKNVARVYSSACLNEIRTVYKSCEIMTDQQEKKKEDAIVAGQQHFIKQCDGSSIWCVWS